MAIGGLLTSAVLAAALAVAIVVRLDDGTPITFTITGQAFEVSAGLGVYWQVASLVSIFTYASWLSWQYRVHTNAVVIGPDKVPTSPAWGVLCWFVPFVNLVKPFQVVREIQRASSIGRVRTGRWIAWLWWACWIAATLVVSFAFVRFFSALVGALSVVPRRTPEFPPVVVELTPLTLQLFVVAEVLVVADAVLAILIVSRITRDQIVPPAFLDAPVDHRSPLVPPRPDLG